MVLCSCCKKEEAASVAVHAAAEPAPAPRRNSEDATEDSEPSVGGGKSWTVIMQALLILTLTTIISCVYWVCRITTELYFQ